MTDRTGTYIAGPMHHHPQFNFPAFFEAERWVRSWFDYPLLNPARRDIEDGFDPTTMQGTPAELESIKFDVHEARRQDYNFIVNRAARVVMLPGWSRSVGARIEHDLAASLGLAVIYLTSAGTASTKPEPCDL